MLWPCDCEQMLINLFRCVCTWWREWSSCRMFKLNSACKLKCLPHVCIVLLQLLHEVHNLADL